MTLCRLIAPDWLLTRTPCKKVLEGLFTNEQLKEHNDKGYNVYFLPNGPSDYTPGTVIDGTHIDTFNYVFVDCDLKDKVYSSKDAFIEKIAEIDILPTRIVDSGHGIHVYWQVSDLDAKSYLRFQRRLMRLFKTDEAVAKIFQLMRLPGYFNTKYEDDKIECLLLGETDEIYTSEQLDKLLPAITAEDEAYCTSHYEKTHNTDRTLVQVSDKMPDKFGELLRKNKEIKQLWLNNSDDRSRNDYKLAFLLEAEDFTPEEVMSVLVNCDKALARAPIHRLSYAQNIVDQVPFRTGPTPLVRHNSVEAILNRAPGKSLQGDRFPCAKYMDDTEHGFRLGHVMGLVAGAGVGKTSMTLNMFMDFVKCNPDYEHFFIPLEQTETEIALIWQTMCGKNTNLHKKVHILSNYDEDDSFRDLSLTDIEEYILAFQKQTGKKVGCVVIDHIGILCNNNRLGQDEGVKQISKAMKGFAIRTNTFLIMQSQTSREKAGIGDLELFKDAAFGTSTFENFCDYLVTLWQPLKRMYRSGAPTVISYKFCKIRHKNQKKDVIVEDVPYTVFYDPDTKRIRSMTQEEEMSFNFFLPQATNKRKIDRKTELVAYQSIKGTEGDMNAKTETDSDRQSSTSH